MRVEGRFHPEPQRRAFVHLDSDGERTITVLGPRLGPSGDDDLPWDLLDDTDAVYVTAGDLDAVRQARRARVLVATPRGLDTLAEAHVQLDALVSSGRDPGERYSPGDLDPEPKVVVRTLGSGRGRVGDGERRAGQLGPGGAARPGPRRLRRAATASPPASPTGSGPAGRSRRRSSWRPAAVPPASPAAARTGPSSSSTADSGHVAVGRLDRQAVLDPGLQPAVQVVRLEAGGRERLGGERRPAS